MLFSKISSAYYAIETALRMFFSNTDMDRWSDINNLSPEWDERTIQIAKLVPGNSSVLEFGAGRLVLRDFIPGNCRYTPSDLCGRGEGTIICDLNTRPLPDFPENDVLVFSGVLEYLHDVPEVLGHLRHYCQIILASYVCVSEKKTKTILQRRRAAWVNDFSSEEIISIFRSHGFICREEIAFKGTQKIFKFEKAI